MSYVNPYASPLADMPYQAKVAGAPQGMWRDGQILVLRIGAVLPPRCVKSNEPTNSTWKRKLSWHPPWVFALILAHLLIYIIVALILTKRATFEFPLSDVWRTRRRNALLVGWGLALFGIVMFITGCVLASGNDRSTGEIGGLLILVSFLPILGDCIWGIVRGRLLSPQKIDDHFAWVKGAAPDYLATLPDWPGPYEAYRRLQSSPY